MEREGVQLENCGGAMCDKGGGGGWESDVDVYDLEEGERMMFKGLPK